MLPGDKNATCNWGLCRSVATMEHPEGRSQTTLSMAPQAGVNQSPRLETRPAMNFDSESF
ncbi:hypothetical protein EHV23_12970 [Lautropia dentalis]|uniref:Uncharacterized protein n=1 Tax=Lautropia dentalis TaxID=2490857 RepID=A0A426FNJ8_9BURK|nr:hypothetical protein [Lautropia dentalis]RRN44240.1 hypothetical protein EHV23_12970 [Lautropia dentalis]